MSVRLIEMKKIKFKELAEEIKRLNDSGFLKKEIKTVGKTKEVLVDLFVEAVQSIPDDVDGNWTGPEETAEYYMSLLETDAEKIENEWSIKEENIEEKESIKEEKPQYKEKRKRKGRWELTGFVIKNEREISFEDLVEKVDSLYDGRSNKSSTISAVSTAISVLVGFGVVVYEGKIVKLV